MWLLPSDLYFPRSSLRLAHCFTFRKGTKKKSALYWTSLPPQCPAEKVEPFIRARFICMLARLLVVSAQTSSPSGARAGGRARGQKQQSSFERGQRTHALMGSRGRRSASLHRSNIGRPSGRPPGCRLGMRFKFQRESLARTLTPGRGSKDCFLGGKGGGEVKRSRWKGNPGNPSQVR